MRIKENEGSMKKGQIYEGIVEYVSFPNKGVLNIEGEKVIVKHAIAGQKISLSISKKRKGNNGNIEVLMKKRVFSVFVLCLILLSVSSFKD